VSESAKRKKPAGRSQLARQAHLRGGAGAMGGSRKQGARRRRHQARLDELRAQRETRAGGTPDV